MNPTHNYLIIKALGPNRSDAISELSRACTQCGCNILNAKMTSLGQELSITLFISGNWGGIAKMEATLPSLEQRLGLTLLMRRTGESPVTTNTMTYNIQISAIDKAGILNSITDFLFRLAIPIEDITANTYITHTGTRMLNLLIRINIPESMHLATFREQFIGFCDDNNLDAYLEPIRHI